MKQPLIELAGFKRDEINEFVVMMRNKLIQNSVKSRSWAKWGIDTKTFLRSKLHEEIVEYDKSGDPFELVDIANICLMLYLRKMKGID